MSGMAEALGSIPNAAKSKNNKKVCGQSRTTCRKPGSSPRSSSISHPQQKAWIISSLKLCFTSPASHGRQHKSSASHTTTPYLDPDLLGLSWKPVANYHTVPGLWKNPRVCWATFQGSPCSGVLVFASRSDFLREAQR